MSTVKILPPSLPSSGRTRVDDYSAARSRVIPPLPWPTFAPPFPDRFQAGILDVDEGFPLLVARRCSFDADNKPVEYVDLTFRSDRYRFQLEMRR
jgi:hypothetical protein